MNYMKLLFVVANLMLSSYSYATMVEVGHVIVINSNDDSISLIQPKTYKEIRRVYIGKGPHHLLPTPDNKHLIVGNTISNELVIIDPLNGKFIKRISKISDPYHIGFSPDGRYFVANGNRLNHVDIYRYKSLEFELIARIKLHYTPSHMAFDENNIVYITLQDSDRLVAIDVETRKTKWFASTGRSPAGVWITPDRKHVLVGNTSTDYVDVFLAVDGSHIKRIKTGKGAHNFLPVGDGRHVLISNRVENTISIIDQNKLRVVDQLKVPGGPDDMEMMQNGKELWVTSRWRNRVSVIDMKTRKLKYYIKVGRSPHGIYYHKHALRR